MRVRIGHILQHQLALGIGTYSCSLGLDCLRVELIVLAAHTSHCDRAVWLLLLVHV